MDLPKYVHKSWAKCPAWEELEPIRAYFRQQGHNTKTILPGPDDIFKAFQFPVNTMNTVLLGQDPYPNPDDASGVAFGLPSTRPDFSKWPLSLRVLTAAVDMWLSDKIKDTGEVHPICYYVTKPGDKPHHFSSYIDETLGMWQSSNIMMLNAALTTIASRPGAHWQLWKPFTTKVLRFLDHEDRCFWFVGSKAQQYLPLIQKGHVVTSPHPARLGRVKDEKGKWEIIAAIRDSIEQVDEFNREKSYKINWVFPF